MCGSARTRSRFLGPGLLGLLLVVALAGCAGTNHRVTGPGPGGRYLVGKPYQINGQWYFPAEDATYDRVGLASWYGREFRGNSTANGETFDPRRMTAAHTTLPMPVLVRVTNLENGRVTTVRVNDRGPFVAGRLIDLSEAAAEELGFRGQGIARVRVQYVGRADQSELPIARTSPPSAPPPTPTYVLTTPAGGYPIPPQEAEGSVSSLEGVESAIQLLPSRPPEPLTQ